MIKLVFRCYYLDQPRKLTVVPLITEPLLLYEQQQRNYSPCDAVQFLNKNLIPSVQANQLVADFGFCPDRYNRVEMDDLDCEDVFEYDPDRLTFVASFGDRVRLLLPPDACVEDIQNETFSTFMFLEYLAKCRERGAFIHELKAVYYTRLSYVLKVLNEISNAAMRIGRKD